jgi:hypothetical protein
MKTRTKRMAPLRVEGLEGRILLAGGSGGANGSGLTNPNLRAAMVSGWATSITGPALPAAMVSGWATSITGPA